MSDKPRDEAERLAEEEASKAQFIKTGADLFMDMYCKGFRAGEKSERVMKLVEAVNAIKEDLEGNAAEFLPIPAMEYQEVLDALAAFNASEKDGEG